MEYIIQEKQNYKNGKQVRKITKPGLSNTQKLRLQKLAIFSVELK